MNVQLLKAARAAEEALRGAVTLHSNGCAMLAVSIVCDCWISDRLTALALLRQAIAAAEAVPPAHSPLLCAEVRRVKMQGRERNAVVLTFDAGGDETEEFAIVNDGERFWSARIRGPVSDPRMGWQDNQWSCLMEWKHSDANHPYQVAGAVWTALLEKAGVDEEYTLPPDGEQEVAS